MLTCTWRVTGDEVGSTTGEHALPKPIAWATITSSEVAQSMPKVFLSNICDGRALSREILESLRQQVSALPAPPELGVVLVGSNPASVSYVRLKMRKAASIGVKVRLFEFSESTDSAVVIAKIEDQVRLHRSVIVQLPLPSGFDTDEIVNEIPASRDVDILSADAKRRFATGDLIFDHPVVGAMREILQAAGMSVPGKRTLVVGHGALVGQPAAAWFQLQGSEVSVATKETSSLAKLTKNADIIVCGAGVPGLIRPEMVQDGVVILDAGTSEDHGILKGDADPDCADRARLFTPVPGGIGPITVSVLLRNVVRAATR